MAWAERAVELGAGELLVTSIDRDGTGAGFDTDLLRAISERVRVPVIASGGAAGPADFVRAIRDGGADAVLAASIFHRRIHSIGDVKAAMAEAGLAVRIVPGEGGVSGTHGASIPTTGRLARRTAACCRRSSRIAPTVAS